MIALRILDIKKFMSAFLIGNELDEYSLIEAQITTFCTFSIDGRLEHDFFSESETALKTPESGRIDYIPWKLTKERCFDMIKGKRTPLAFKFVFFYPDDHLLEFLSRDDVTVSPALLSGLCINVRFDGTNLLITTGTSMKGFTPDRSADAAWDKLVLSLIERIGVRAEQL